MQRKLPLFCLLFASLGVATVFCQTNDKKIWQQIDKRQLRKPTSDSRLPQRYAAFRLNREALERLLRKASDDNREKRKQVLTLPMPDGSLQRFEVQPSLVVSPELLKKYPELGATYSGKGIDDPTATARFDLLPSGFHSMILSSNGTILVDPYSREHPDIYISYHKQDKPSQGVLRERGSM